MRLRVTVNDGESWTAGVGQRGFVGTHVIATVGDDNEAHVESSGHDTTDERVTVHRRWQKVDVRVGDKVLVECVEAGEVSPPVVERLSTEDERIAVRDKDIAAALTQRLDGTVADLLALIETVNAAESPENAKKFSLAVGNVVWEIGSRLLGPIYAAHPELRPPELRDSSL
jgi:hypothetical protein